MKLSTSTIALIVSFAPLAAAQTSPRAVATAGKPATPPPGSPLSNIPPALLAPPQMPKSDAPVSATPAPAPEPLPEPEAPLELVTTEDLQGRIKELEIQLQQTRELVTHRRPTVTLSGYADFGFFVPQGDGSGIVRDSGNQFFPEYSNRYGWVFLGDLLAPTVNSRGEVADLGEAAGASRFDSVRSGGAPSFIANEINLTLQSGLSESVLATASVNFMPRTGSDFSLGDFVDIDVAQVEWLPTKSGKTSVFVGKFDSLLGIEYRDRKASQRFGITPSLLARYTVGTALGLKMRTKIGPEDFLVLAGAVTNGSNTTEQFHFYDEVDLNAGKTASGRIALRTPVPFEAEVGVSGSYGAQDRARDSSGTMWFLGVDLLATLGPIDLKAQWLRGASPGNPEDDVYGLDLRNGGYLELDWMLTSQIGLVGRGEFRDAFVWLGDADAPEGANRAYLTKSWRATAGTKVVFNERIVLKAEYLRNGEYGGIPEIRNDMFTTSLLFMN